MRRFWVVLYAITAIVHVPFALGLRWTLARTGDPAGPLAGGLAAWSVALATTAALVAALRIVVATAREDRPRPRWRTVLLEEPYYVHWCAAVGSALFYVPAALVAWVASTLGAAAPGSGALAAGLYAFFLVVAAYAVFVRRRWVRVRTVEVPVRGLPAPFDGYTIAHLSDLHVGGHTPRTRAEAWRARVDAMGVDLVALTGDYVTSGVAFHRDIADVLSGFHAKDGTFAVMGNHDYFGDGEPLISLLRAGGVRVLRNEHATIERGGARIGVAGVDDTWTRRADVRRAVEGRDVDVPLLALAHDPALFPALAAEGADVVLSGHTHWGQVGVPFFAATLNMSRLTWRYHAGTYREGEATLVISPGLGTTGPPARLGSPPEITIVRLRRAAPEGAAALRAEGA
jgi:predicted MPP superfamily phosphohydrolase